MCTVRAHHEHEWRVLAPFTWDIARGQHADSGGVGIEPILLAVRLHEEGAGEEEPTTPLAPHRVTGGPASLDVGFGNGPEDSRATPLGGLDHGTVMARVHVEFK